MVINGIDRILEFSTFFKNRRLGLVSSIAGRNQELISSLDILHQQFRLCALFSPEHGIRGDKGAGEEVQNYIDPATQLPVYSLYNNQTKHLTPEMLESIDTLIYDIQDVGSRYYTYISTLFYIMEDIAQAGKELIILDRCNPLGNRIEGTILDLKFQSFVGAYSLPNRHGMTIGELAKLYAQEQKLSIDLKIIPCLNYYPDTLFPESGRIWMMPSLGIPTFETALLYSGTCLFEGTNLSEGRGTTCPFKIIGAPFIRGIELAQKLNALKLPGILFTDTYFTPSFSKYQGTFCQGVHLHITDLSKVSPLSIALEMIYMLKADYPAEFQFLNPSAPESRNFISLLAGNNFLMDNISKADYFQSIQQDQALFEERRKPFCLY